MRKVFLFLLLSISVSSCTSSQEKDSLLTQNATFYIVTKVVDGDTFWIDDGSGDGKKIRLIGIDAPESRKTGNKEIGYFGKEAKEYLTSLLRGKKVRLDYDVTRYDKFHRTLAYAYTENGIFINDHLLKNGYAVVMTIAPNVKFADRFAKVQAEARRGKRGLWAKQL